MLWNTSLASARYPFDFWADKLEKAEIHLLPQSDWLRDFLHKHLIYVAIILRMFRDTNLALSTSGVTSYTETECRDFVKHRIQPTHPLIARKILDKLFVQTGWNGSARKSASRRSGKEIKELFFSAVFSRETKWEIDYREFSIRLAQQYREYKEQVN